MKNIVFINAINLTAKKIELLRSAIKAGEIVPCKREIENYVKLEYVDEFMNGDRIFPQMYYIINAENIFKINQK